MKSIGKEYQFLVKDQDATFRLYVDRPVIGEKIFFSLMNQRNGVDDDGKSCDGFYLTTKDNEVGLMSQLYGLSGIFTLINRYNIVPSTVDMGKLKDGVCYVVDYIDSHGYDLNPYLDTKVNTYLFNRKNHYVGAMTWALSLLIAVRVAHTKKIIDFTDYMPRIMKNIRYIVRFFVDKVIGSEDNPLGWGYANDCLEPSLFFTYSVVETFADFEDCILGAKDGYSQDDELLAYINEGSHHEDSYDKRYKDLCNKIGDRAWQLYKHTLKKEFFSDKFGENFKIISKEEILNSSRSSVLFNSLYIIFIIFYSSVNLRNVEEHEEIVNSMTLGLQLVQNLFDELKALGKDSIVDKHIIAYDQAHAHLKDFGKELNEESIQASSLLPMLVKANNLIAYYILQFPQQKMGELFDLMLQSKMDDEWLWENRKFDLLSTERYLEAIADFYDYYEKYEKQYAEKSITNDKLRKDLTKELTPIIAKTEAERLNKAHRRDIENIKNDAKKQFPIEAHINDRIDAKIEEKSLEIITDALNKIIVYNTANVKSRKEMEFTPIEARLKSVVENITMSYFGDDIKRIALKVNEMDKDKLQSSIKDDIKMFVAEFCEFIARNNVDKIGDNKLSLSDIFELIIKK